MLNNLPLATVPVRFEVLSSQTTGKGLRDPLPRATARSVHSYQLCGVCLCFFLLATGLGVLVGFFVR